jgi:AsmA protein
MRLLKYLAYVIMVCIALVIGGAIYTANYLNPNDYKPQISEHVERATGRKLTINGNIYWSFFPWLGVVVKDAQLSNASGFSEKPFAKIQEVSVEIKLLPLLRKQVEIGSLTFKGLELQLTKNTQGVSNWEGLTQQTKKDAYITPNPSNDTAQQKQAFAFSISDINISNSSLVWDDQQKKQLITLSNIELQSKNIMQSNEFPVSLSFTAAINKINATLKTEGIVNTLAQTIKLSKLNTTIANLVTTGQLEINNVLTSPNLTGKIEIPTFDLRQFLQSVEEKALNPYDANVLKTASATFNIRATSKNLHLDNIKARLDETQITGNLEVNDFETKNITLEALIDQIHIDRYMESKEKPAKLFMSNIKTSGTAKLGDGTFNQLAANGRLQLGTLQAGEIKASAVDAHININHGLIVLDPVTAELYQGKSSGSINVDMKTPLTRLTSRQTLTNIQIEPLLNDIKALTQLKVSGNTNLETQLTASGKDSAALTRSLNGQVKFAVNKGILYGTDIDLTMTTFINTMDALVRNIKSSPGEILSAVGSKINPILQNRADQKTNFDTFTGNINIANGIAQNNDLLMKTGTMKITGAGTANLVNQTIDYRLSAIKTDPKTNQPYNYELPIVVTGPMAHPKIGLDSNYVNQVIQKEVGRVAKNKLADVVTQQVTKQLGEEAGKKIGEQLKNLNLDKLFK